MMWTHYCKPDKAWLSVVVTYTVAPGMVTQVS